MPAFLGDETTEDKKASVRLNSRAKTVVAMVVRAV
jgi:hypothetical protein